MDVNTKGTPDGFLMDYSLHRVAKYLRLLGYNAICNAHIRHRQLLQMAERENLVLITSSPSLINQLTAHNRAVRLAKESSSSPKHVLVAYDSDGESIYSDDESGEREIMFCEIPQNLQGNFKVTMVYVIRHLGLCYDAYRVFSRCVLCNDELARVSKESVQGDVHETVYEAYDSFTRCPKCQKVFWGVDGSNVFNYTSFRTVELLQRLCREANAEQIKPSNIFSLSVFRSFPMIIRTLVLSFLQEEDLRRFESVFPSMKNLANAQKQKNERLKTISNKST